MSSNSTQAWLTFTEAIEYDVEVQDGNLIIFIYQIIDNSPNIRMVNLGPLIGDRLSEENRRKCQEAAYKYHEPDMD